MGKSYRPDTDPDYDDEDDMSFLGMDPDEYPDDEFEVEEALRAADRARRKKAGRRSRSLPDDWEDFDYGSSGNSDNWNSNWR